MPNLTISEASRLVQISRTTMYNRYIKTGEVSVIKENGKMYINTSELFRVFPNAKIIEQVEPFNCTTIEQPVKSNNNHFEQLLQAKNDVINILKEQLDNYKNENLRLKELETKFIQNITKKKKFLGIF